MPKIGDFLGQLFRGLSVNEAAEKTGIDPAVLSRLLRSKSSPSPENVLRIAFATGTHPARIFEAAGHKSLAHLCRQINWELEDRDLSERDLYTPRAASVHSRVQRLIDHGFLRQIEAAIEPLEAAWEVLRPALETVARDTGAKAAALIADSPARSGDVLFTWNCPEPLALELVQKRKVEDWQSYQHKAAELTLTLFLKAPRPGAATRKHAQMAVAMLAVSLSKI